MDHDRSPMDQKQQQAVCVDILSNEAVENPVVKSCDHSTSVEDDVVKLELGSQENYMIIVKEKRQKQASSAKKPPRPHRGFSLDAADHKLIKELAQLKRARIERMKALMQKKAAAKASSSNYSSLFAMIFTIIVFIVIIFQGMSCQISCGTFQGCPPEKNESGLIFVHEELNPSAHDSV